MPRVEAWPAGGTGAKRQGKAAKQDVLSRVEQHFQGEAFRRYHWQSKHANYIENVLAERRYKQSVASSGANADFRRVSTDTRPVTAAQLAQLPGMAHHTAARDEISQPGPSWLDTRFEAIEKKSLMRDQMFPRHEIFLRSSRLAKNMRNKTLQLGFGDTERFHVHKPASHQAVRVLKPKEDTIQSTTLGSSGSRMSAGCFTGFHDTRISTSNVATPKEVGPGTYHKLHVVKHRKSAGTSSFSSTGHQPVTAGYRTLLK